MGTMDTPQSTPAEAPTPGPTPRGQTRELLDMIKSMKLKPVTLRTASQLLYS